MIPKFSPYCLIQESLFPNEWLVLVSCVLLNCTRRKQIESIFPTFVERYPDPESLLSTTESEIAALIKPLGFMNRRTRTLVKLAETYMGWDHVDPLTLPGIGEYASRAWKIFVRNDIGDEPPNDGALVLYWNWHVSSSKRDASINS